MGCQPYLAYTINYKHFKNGSLLEMLDSGIKNFRINLGRTSIEICQQMCDELKRIATNRNQEITIEIDLPGAKARIATDTELYVEEGQRMFLSAVVENNAIFHTNSDWLIRRLIKGDILRVGRKGAKASIHSIFENMVEIEFIQSGKVKDKDIIMVENRAIELPFITADDEKYILQISSFDFDFLAISFTQNKEQINNIRQKLFLERGKTDVKLIAKIEEPVGITNFEEILDAADGIMIGRGDMSEHIGMKNTNQFIDQVLEKWRYGNDKELMLASYYFVDYLEGNGPMDQTLKKQAREFVTYFVTDESSYYDWKIIYDVYMKELF